MLDKLTTKIDALRAQLSIKNTIASVLSTQVDELKDQCEELRTQNEALTVTNLALVKELRRVRAQYEVVAGELAKVEPWWQAQDQDISDAPEHHFISIDIEEPETSSS